MCYMSVLILTRFFSMCGTCIVRTASDSRIKMLCYADFNITAQVDESVLHIWIKTQEVIDYVCCTCFVSTSNYSRIFFKCFVAQTFTYNAQVDECVTCLF